MEHLFYIPYWRFRLPHWEFRKKQIQELTCQVETPNGAVKSELFNHVFTILGQDLDAAAEEVVEKDSVSYSTPWFHRSIKGQAHDPHDHGHHGYTCCLYLNFDPELHDPTHFIAPFQPNCVGNMSVWGNRDMPVEEGDLCIWPANILHFIRPNNSDVPREILAFNILC